jgi:hypothetical protein
MVSRKVTEAVHPHHKAYVCTHVFEDTRPVLLVDRADGDWCFLCGDLHQDEPSSIRVVGAGHILERDPTLQPILDLPANWEAEREHVGAPWIRKPNERDS